MITEVRWNLWLVTARVAETAPTQGAQSSGNSNWFLGDEEFHNLTGNMKNLFLVGCVTGIPSKIALIIRKKTQPGRWRCTTWVLHALNLKGSRVSGHRI